MSQELIDKSMLKYVETEKAAQREPFSFGPYVKIKRSQQVSGAGIVCNERLIDALADLKTEMRFKSSQIQTMSAACTRLSEMSSKLQVQLWHM